MALIITFTINSLYSGTRLGLCWLMLEERYEEYRGQVELSTILREVSLCTEKAPARPSLTALARCGTRTPPSGSAPWGGGAA